MLNATFVSNDAGDENHHVVSMLRHAANSTQVEILGISRVEILGISRARSASVLMVRVRARLGRRCGCTTASTACRSW